MAAGDLTDLATVKDWLGNPATSDGQLVGLISAASTFIKGYLSRDIVSTAYTELYQGNGQTFMGLRQYPVISISGVQWAGQASSLAAANPLTLTSGYYADPDGSTLRLIGYCFPKGLPVQVSYTAGYANVPADIAQACVELVGEAFKRKGRIGVVSQQLNGQETISYSQRDMNPAMKSVLAQYMRLAPF